MASSKRKPASKDGWEDVPAKGTAAPKGSDGWEDAPITPSDERVYNKMDLVGTFNEAGRKTAMPGFMEDIFNFGTGAVDKLSLGNAQYSPKFKDALLVAERDSPNATAVGKGAGYAGLGLANLLAPGGMLAQMGMGALQTAATKPDGENSPSQDLEKRVTNAGTGIASSMALTGAGKMARSGGDKLMQLAVGRNKMTPGTGEMLINEGIWKPTRDGMKKQVDRKKGEVFEEMLQSVNGDAAVHSSAPVAQRVLQVGKSKVVPGASPSAMDKPTLDAIEDASQDIMSRGEETLSQMLRRRSAAGGRGYSNVTDASRRGLEADISKAEQLAYSDILKANAPQLQTLDPRYAALAKASKGLNQEAPLHQSWSPAGMALRGGAALGAGSATGSVPLGIAVGAMSTPGAQAGLAHILNRAGRAQQALTPAELDMILRGFSQNQEPQ